MKRSECKVLTAVASGVRSKLQCTVEYISVQFAKRDRIYINDYLERFEFYNIDRVQYIDLFHVCGEKAEPHCAGPALTRRPAGFDGMHSRSAIS